MVEIRFSPKSSSCCRIDLSRLFEAIPIWCSFTRLTQNHLTIAEPVLISKSVGNLASQLDHKLNITGKGIDKEGDS